MYIVGWSLFHLALTSIVTLALLVLGGHTSVYAANSSVTTTADSADGVCDSHCSLREAVIAANGTPLVPDSISLPAGTYVIGGARGDDTAATGDLDVTCTSVGCIRVGNSDTVNLTNVVVADSVSAVSGGGLSSSGNLDLTNSTVSGNSAANGGGRPN